jgi:hypothetical protein
VTVEVRAILRVPSALAAVGLTLIGSFMLGSPDELDVLNDRTSRSTSSRASCGAWLKKRSPAPEGAGDR